MKQIPLVVAVYSKKVTYLVRYLPQAGRHHALYQAKLLCFAFNASNKNGKAELSKMTSRHVPSSAQYTTKETISEVYMMHCLNYICLIFLRTLFVTVGLLPTVNFNASYANSIANGCLKKENCCKAYTTNAPFSCYAHLKLEQVSLTTDVLSQMEIMLGFT